MKILDALAAGVPTVTTRYGNEGIRAREGEEILVADTPGDFAAAVTNLLRDEDARHSIGDSGRRFVKARFSNDAFIGTVEALYREIACKGYDRFGGYDLREEFTRVELDLRYTFELKHFGILGVGVKKGQNP